MDKHWEKTCGEIANQEFLRTVTCSRQNLIRQLDKSDTRIEEMKEYLDLANDQYKRLFGGHVQVIDYIMSK